MRILKVLKQLTLLLIFTIFAASVFAAQKSDGAFLVLSDFHYDATNNKTSGENDSTQVIFNSLKKTITSLAKSRQLKPDFVLVLGDFLTHGFGEYHHYQHRAIQTSLEVPLAMLESAIANDAINVKIFPVIGNNDYYCGDYCTSLKNLGKSGNFFFDTEKTWEPYVKKNGVKTDFSETFIKGGYYSATPLAQYPQNKIIVINNVPFAPEKSNPHADVSKAEYVAYIKGELTYLEDKLIEYRQEKDSVILAYHIPNLEICEWNDFAKGIKNKYGNSLLEIINKYKKTIGIIFAGHTHVNFLTLIGQNGVENTPIEAVGSIAKPFTPTFNIFHYNRVTGIIDQHATEIYEYHAEKNSWEKI